MNTKITEVLTRISKNENLLKDFEKLDDLEKIYHFFSKFNDQITKKEIENFLKIEIAEYLKKELGEKEMEMISGGKITQKFSAGLLSLLSVATFVSQAGAAGSNSIQDSYAQTSITQKQNKVTVGKKILNWFKENQGKTVAGVALTAGGISFTVWMLSGIKDNEIGEVFEKYYKEFKEKYKPEVEVEKVSVINEFKTKIQEYIKRVQKITDPKLKYNIEYMIKVLNQIDKLFDDIKDFDELDKKVYEFTRLFLNDCNALILAASQGHKDIVTAFLATSGIDVNANGLYGWTALILAASKGHKDIVTALLATHDIDVNAKNIGGWTALMLAANKGHKDIVTALLATHDIDVNAKNIDGWTALMLAADRNHEEIKHLLKDV